MVEERVSGKAIEEAEAELEGLRWRLAKLDFRMFLNYVRIEEPGSGVIPFEVWPHLEEMTADQKKEKLMVRLKAKQIGISWWLASLAVWIGEFTPAGLMMLFSRGERESHELIRKAKVVHRLLPAELQIPLSATNMESMVFTKAGRILAYPSTMDAGIGETATCAAIDEADFHPYFEENLTNIKPTVDAGGQLIIASTCNPYVLTSGFKNLYRGAPGNGYHKRFYGWSVRPGRDDEWYRRVMASSLDITTEQKNYPNSEDEALAPPRSIAAFDHDRLNSMRVDVRGPVGRVMCGGVLANIYQGFQAGKRYAAGTDTSHGTGHDAAVTVVVDVVTGYVVADIKNNVLPPDQLAEASAKLLAMYDNPIWGIEDNEWGVLTLATAQRMRYPRLYFREDGVVGWRTDERNRFTLWGELIEAVYSRLLTIPSAEGLSEFYTVIRNPEKRGRIEAQKGAHDDYPMAVGIAWQLRRHARAAGLGARREQQRDFVHQGVGSGGQKRGWTRW